MLPVPVVHGEHGGPDDGRRQRRVEKLRRAHRLMHSANGHNHKRAEGCEPPAAKACRWNHASSKLCVATEFAWDMKSQELGTQCAGTLGVFFKCACSLFCFFPQCAGTLGASHPICRHIAFFSMWKPIGALFFFPNVPSHWWLFLNVPSHCVSGLLCVRIAPFPNGYHAALLLPLHK